MKMPGFRKNNITCFVLGLLFFCEVVTAHNWSFKLKSKVELRSWALSYKAIKNSTILNGASVELYKGSALVSQTVSDGQGNFEMNIPSDGDFTLLIKSEGCNPKKFAVSTKGVPVEKDDVNFKPSVSMVGIIMSRPIGGVKYLGLTDTHVQIEYNKEKSSSETRNYSFSQNIYDGEYLVIQKFCTANKLGDMALEKKEYSLAQIYYLMAMDMMAAEAYPKTQLTKAEEGLKLDKVKGVKKRNVNGKQSKDKTKTNVPNQDFATKPVKSTDFINSSSGKPSHKIRKTLGK